MTDRQPDRTAASRFLTDLAQVMLGSGKTQRQIARESAIPRSTLSDYARVDRTQVPQRELLAALLEACGLEPAQIEAWEQRRIGVLRSQPEPEPAEGRIELLSEQLEQARATIDELRDKQKDLRVRLEKADREKASLAGELDRERAANNRSQERIAELTVRVDAATLQAEALRSTLHSVIDRSRRVEVQAANLRAELNQTETELLYERLRTTRPGRSPGPRSRVPSWPAH